MRLLVCGGRTYGNTQDESYTLCEALDTLHRETRITALIQGGAPGADACAREWAIEHGIRVVTVPALWDIHGKAAGPIRNQRMIDDFKPDMCLSFPGGKGTADMVRRARAAGIEVREHT